MHRLDWIKLITDLVFFGLGAFLFFNSLLLSALILLAIFLLAKYKNVYERCTYQKRFEDFVDFLNQLYANLSVGIQFNNALLTLKEDQCHPRMKPHIHALKKIVHYNGTKEDIYDAITTCFRLEEANAFVLMLNQASKTGAQVATVANITLEHLYFKGNVRREIDAIVFQKKLEHALLVMAPLMILIFLRMTSMGYILVLYDTLQGKCIMGISFAVITLMKWLGQRLIDMPLDQA